MNAAFAKRAQEKRTAVRGTDRPQRACQARTQDGNDPFAGQPARTIPWRRPKDGEAAARPRPSRIASGAFAVATAAALACAPCSAYASTSTTQVMLSADESQISVTVPAELAVAVKADGSFVVPDLSIQNNSVFGVHVSSVKATVAEGFNLVGQGAFDAAEGDNVLWMSLTSSGEETIDLSSCTASAGTTTPSKWAVERAQDGNPGEIVVSGDGAIKDFTKATGDGQEALSVAFTIKAGN